MRCSHSTFIPPCLENKTQWFLMGVFICYFCISQENPHCLSLLAAARVMSCSLERINALSFLRTCSLLSGNLNLDSGLQSRRREKMANYGWRIPDLPGAGGHVRKCANGLLVCVAESQTVCLHLCEGYKAGCPWGALLALCTNISKSQHRALHCSWNICM